MGKVTVGQRQLIEYSGGFFLEVSVEYGTYEIYEYGKARGPVWLCVKRAEKSSTYATIAGYSAPRPEYFAKRATYDIGKGTGGQAR